MELLSGMWYIDYSCHKIIVFWNSQIHTFRDKNKILYNKQCGHMLRTKLSSANEGGVAAGLGALDSPYLIND